ncbi:glycosyltransferase family 2 protein [Qipengyuania sp.]|uniref:glycosyltransferase family 2 protein n=1 Tax=Qipengyuania sp. TaxID=2004515 RepID=UPI0035C81B79
MTSTHDISELQTNGFDGMTNAAQGSAEVTVIIVSYNTRELTLKAVETLLANKGQVKLRIVIFDNASSDGSAAALAEAYPYLEVIAHPENIGFARANNLVAETATTEWLLLLNPDTETHPGAIETLLEFSRAHPNAGITGGRTVFPDGRLNIASCWRRMTVWSLFCSATGLSSAFPRSDLFNPEAFGDWQRDSVREVDIVVGCFLMIRTELWNRLGGFDARYFMYGEEADLCLRARAMGYRPMITPDAEIMHLVGASSTKVSDKVIKVARAKASLIRDHWPRYLQPIGLGLLLAWGLVRRIGYALAALAGGSAKQRDKWREVWRRRDEWLAGY